MEYEAAEVLRNMETTWSGRQTQGGVGSHTYCWQGVRMDMNPGAGG